MGSNVYRWVAIRRRGGNLGLKLGVARIVYELGVYLQLTNDEAQAEKPLTEARAIYVQTIPGRDIRLSNVLIALGRLKLKNGDAAAAETFIRESLQVRMSLLEGNDWESAYMVATLRRCLGALGRMEEATPLLQSGLTVLERKLGAGPPETREIMGVVERY